MAKCRKLGITKRFVSLSELAPVIPLGAAIMAAGYANGTYKVLTDSDLWWTDTFPLRFRIAIYVGVLCNIVNGHVMYATVVWKRVNSD